MTAPILQPPTRPDASLELGLEAARRSLEIESASVAALLDSIGPGFVAALGLIRQARGRVVVSGIGKGGHVGAKIAATLASTGTAAFFVHATEALHGDAGMVTADDVAILISNSGETAEVCQFALLLAERGVPIISMTSRETSSLGRLAKAHLPVGVAREADPLNLAPTASTTATLAMGDALAAALMAASGFRAEDFARNHPGGSLGERLLGPASTTSGEAGATDEPSSEPSAGRR
jgi:arabinose-5-phosphate isomerase